MSGLNPKMTKTYTKGQLSQGLNTGEVPKKYFLFAGKDYVPGDHNFTIYQEFDSLTDFLSARQAHVQDGLNVLSFAF